MKRSRTLLWLLAGGVCALAMTGAAAAQGRSLNVPAGDLKSALDAYIAQTGDQLIYRPEDVAGKRTAGVRGVLAPEQALADILAGTGLKLHRDASGAEVLTRAAPLPVSTQTATDPPIINEVVVTANKRAEKLKDVAVSVAEVSRRDLLRQNADKFEDYAASVPGLTVQNTSVIGSLNQLTLRGVTTGLVGNPTVGVYVDDAPFGATVGVGGSSLTPDIDAADLDRIEVLKGPQGTLYGASSMGGIINFITRSPSTAGVSGWLQEGVVSTSGNIGYSLRGSLNAPISDNAAIMVSGYTREDPGYLDDPAHHYSDINSNFFSGGKISVLWSPTSDTTIRASAVTQRQANNGAGYIDLDTATGKPLLGDLETSHPPGADGLHTTFSLYDVNVKHNFGWGDLMSETSWSEDRLNSRVDYTPTFGPLLSAFFGVSDGGSYVDTTNRLQKFSEELRLTSPAENSFFWQGGLFYTREQIRADQNIASVDATTGAVLSTPALLDNPVSSTYEEIALFGTVGYKFTDRFDVSIGGRVSQNSQRSIQSSTGLLGSAPSDTSSHDTSYTFLFTPRYHVTDNLMVYGRIASGYQPGGPNLGEAGTPATFGASTLVSYEAGLKSDWLHKTVSTDVSVFLIDWSDLQILNFTPTGLSYYGNASKATVRGLEATTSYRPMRGLQFAGNVSYLDAALAQGLGASASVIGAKGAPLPSSPHWTAFLSGDYDFDLVGAWGAFVGASGRYVGDRHGDFVSVFTPALPRTVLPSYYAVDLRAGVKYQRWTFSAYAKNVTDKRGYSAAFSQGAVTAVSLTEPQTFGLKLNTDF